MILSEYQSCFLAFPLWTVVIADAVPRYCALFARDNPFSRCPYQFSAVYFSTKVLAVSAMSATWLCHVEQFHRLREKMEVWVAPALRRNDRQIMDERMLITI
jgi:hypothetical protein